MVDIRGSGGQGQAWRSLRSGELDDLERVLSFLKSLDSVDPDRICITGSGWGGYLVLASLLANTPGLGEVSCGLARAPITDWRLGECRDTYRGYLNCLRQGQKSSCEHGYIISSFCFYVLACCLLCSHHLFSET